MHSASEWVSLLRLRAQQPQGPPAYTFLSSRGKEVLNWSYADLDHEARRFAALLEQQGAHGQAVLLILPSGLPYIAAFFGCLYAGAVAVPVLPPRPHRPDHRLGAVATDCGARLALTETRLLPRVQQALSSDTRVLSVDSRPESGPAPDWRPEPEQIAFLQYTSGSTADPKGVQVSHAHLWANQKMMAHAFETEGDFSVVGWLPLHHDMGLIGNVLHPLYQGARCVLMAPETFLMRPIRWLEAIDRYRATTSGSPNFGYDFCVDRIPEQARAQLDLTCWKVAYNGAEPVRQSTLQRFAEAFADSGFSSQALTPCYGLAEATLVVSAAPVNHAPVADEEQRVACGAPPPGTQVLIVDAETRQPVPQGTQGEIWVRGPAVAGGYHGRPDLSRQTFRAQLAGAGNEEATYLRTGDLGYLQDGALYVCGRLKDLIIVAGQNYHPQDVENCAEAADSNLIRGGSAAVAVPRGGTEEVVLIAELHRRSTEDLAEVAARIKERVLGDTGLVLADIRLIRQGTLPRTSSGKVRRHACSEAYAHGHLAPVQRPTS